MQRTVLHLKPEQYKKLHSMAKKAHVSLAEMNRRAIEYYLNEPQENLDALNLMVEALLKSNIEAKKALEEAEHELNGVLRSIKQHQ